MSTTNPTGFLLDTIGEAERMNSSRGHHFFDADTLRFFSSRVHEPIIAHRFFITSEKSGFDDPTRRSTIRMVRNSGEVETVGDFQTFSNPASARKVLDLSRRPLDPDEYGRGTLALAGVTVRFDPYESDLITPEGEPGWLTKAAGTITERGLDRRHSWRAYVGTLAIGSRTTKADAREMAREASSPCPLA
jgi:hypothetical protein